ncbi:TetR/AcrR family transcriptional regulator [Chryseobacterium caseinilyticum]|uniref:TetR/AcrR family transcriptional regulator n=1 Tax=Chryseobacterium caseinilyticum TaxID=2771428 RepID=A0ABR8Z7X8_9FLAO|nr:TetR/AcrR family transcriptional regulator [Chryseobacterium caseinilyticum]MBD8081025.1 TetR/AcrR family transcriptional regulator [Chryseobacterium caseinilyticum]
MGRNKEFDYEQKLDIALELFWKQGFHSTSITDLENGMRINRSSIYPTYGDKKALLIKCLTKYMKSKVSEYESVLDDSQSDAIETLRKTLRLAIDQSIREERTCLAVKIAFEVALTDEDVRILLAGNEKKIEKVYLEILEKGQEQSCIKGDLDPKLTAAFLAGSSSALFKNYALNKNRKTIYDMIETLIQMIKV